MSSAVSHPIFQSHAALTGLSRYKILLNTFSWYTMKYPSCHSWYFLAFTRAFKYMSKWLVGYSMTITLQIVVWLLFIIFLDNCFGEYPYTLWSVAFTRQSFLTSRTSYKEVCPSHHGTKIVSRSLPVQVLPCSLRKRAQGATPTRRWICWQTFSQSWGTWCRLHDTRRRGSAVSWDGGNFSSRYYRTKYELCLYSSS